MQYFPDPDRFPACETKSVRIDMATASELARMM
jgi:hypothetical protein